jgi:hypothetical protein
VAPKYFLRLEQRTHLLTIDDVAFVGRPDIVVLAGLEPPAKRLLPLAASGVVEVTVPMLDEVNESYLEVHEVATGEVITVLELLSPANKLYNQGRKDYERKRGLIFRTLTNLVEIDLLRAGEPMPVSGRSVKSNYRILVSRGHKRPRAELYPFNLRQPIPLFSLPLLPGDNEPEVDVGTILHAMYERARYDLSLDYSRPPVPPLDEEDVQWAQELIALQESP